MKKTQLEIIKERLNTHGYVSRNWCLFNYISRLGARIADCKKEGYQLKGEFVETENGKDYVYRLIDSPRMPQIENNKPSSMNIPKKDKTLTGASTGTNSYTLDSQLRAILQQTPLNWDNAEKIKEIEQAIKSKYETVKKAVIRKYNLC